MSEAYYFVKGSPYWQACPKIEVTGDDLRYCIAEAKDTREDMSDMISQINTDETKEEHRSEDLLHGMLGNYALSMFLYGNKDAFLESRRICHLNPKKGDGGCDLPSKKVDIKTTFARFAWQPGKYHLWIRQREWYEDHLYVSALVDKDSDDCYVVYLIGWAYTKDLPKEHDPGTDRYSLLNSQLRPISTLVEAINKMPTVKR